MQEFVQSRPPILVHYMFAGRTGRWQRDEFRDIMKKQSEANEAAWIQAKAKLEADWRLFEVEVKKYVESFGKQIEHQQATTSSRCPIESVARSSRQAWQRRQEIRF